MKEDSGSIEPVHAMLPAKQGEALRTMADISGGVVNEPSPAKASGESSRKRMKLAQAGDADADGPVRRGLFEKDLPGMMYGFGDNAAPRHETVELVEDVVFEYVSSLLHRAMETAAIRGKLKYEDFVWQVKDEPHKLERLKDLLEKNEEIKKARKMDYDKTDLLALGAAKKEAAAAAAAAEAQENDTGQAPATNNDTTQPPQNNPPLSHSEAQSQPQQEPLAQNTGEAQS
ncbi:hypothetical protein BSKO_08341 [Bryopsis sp. KO-2023]|nr:hypothetical protein BSKO_08341 [Bryopsis sp. KO-2023]